MSKTTYHRFLLLAVTVVLLYNIASARAAVLSQRRQRQEQDAGDLIPAGRKRVSTDVGEHEEQERGVQIAPELGRQVAREEVELERAGGTGTRAITDIRFTMPVLMPQLRAGIDKLLAKINALFNRSDHALAS